MKIATLLLILSLAIPASANSKVLVVCGGDNQTGRAGSTLPVKLCVMAVNDGRPAPGVAVSFTDNGAGGTFSTNPAITGSKGKASTSYTLPSRAETVVIEAVAPGYAAVRFTETGRLLFGLMAVPQSAYGQTFSVLYSFTNEVDGVSPDSLVLDAAGNLYGTTFYGGFGANGTVYKLDTAGKKNLLYQFKELPDGNGPGSVVRDSAGNLFGVTYYGGFGCSIYLQGCGTVFKLDASGKETILHRFGREGDGRFPNGVIRDAAGNLYGTTVAGGVLSLCGSGCGTIFKVDASGKETVLYRFRNGTDGEIPLGGVIRDAAGNLYGTTGAGGANSYGTVFMLDANGKLTVLHSLTISEGCYAAASLFRDAAGNLYGTTSSCGEFGDGTVFKVAPSGKTTVLHTFTGGTDGGVPGPVVGDKAGNLYGSTSFGGDLSSPICTLGGNTPGCGVVFQIDTTGQYTVLHTFDGTDGQWASYGVIRDSAGNLYGTAADGDIPTGVFGTVFKIEP